MKKILAIIPFLLVLIWYNNLSTERQEQKEAIGEKEMITPYYSQIFDAGKEYITEKTGTVFSPFMTSKEIADAKRKARKACMDENSEMTKREAKKFCKSKAYQEPQLWNDIKASMFRLLSGIFIASFIAFFFGLALGSIKLLRNTLSPFIVFLSIIPPLALLPAFLLILGTGEIAKISLIVVGLVFIMTRDMQREVQAFPEEMRIKAMTLGANSFDIMFRIIAPQMMPVMLNMMRLNMGSAWLFLLASEAMAATAGLGYSIYLAQRYLAMDAIIFYVCVITLLGFILDKILKVVNEWLFPWYAEINGGKK